MSDVNDIWDDEEDNELVLEMFGRRKAKDDYEHVNKPSKWIADKDAEMSEYKSLCERLNEEIACLRAQLHSEIVSHADIQKAYEFERDILREERGSQRENIKTLRLELINQWQTNHWENCGNGLDQNLSCSRGEECHWPLPKCLFDITPEEVIAAIRSQK